MFSAAEDDGRRDSQAGLSLLRRVNGSGGGGRASTRGPRVDRHRQRSRLVRYRGALRVETHNRFNFSQWREFRKISLHCALGKAVASSKCLAKEGESTAREGERGRGGVIRFRRRFGCPRPRVARRRRPLRQSVCLTGTKKKPLSLSPSPLRTRPAEH